MASFSPTVSSAADAPWIELGGPLEPAGSGWSETAAVLRQHYPSLREEAIALWRRGGEFKWQPECIHNRSSSQGMEAGGGGGGGGGEWWQLPVVGVDFVAKQNSGCDEVRSMHGKTRRPLIRLTANTLYTA